MSIAKAVLDDGIFLGHFFVVDGDMNFSPRLDLKRKGMIELGDIVYFMFVDGILKKIGKAGGKHGWACRIGTYNRGINGDATNKLIIEEMHKIGANRIEVYAYQTPRAIVSVWDPLNKKTIDVEVSTNQEYERRYTHEYLAESAQNNLPFCRQLN